MKEKYEAPKLEIMCMSEDIITSSPEDNDYELPGIQL